MGFSLHLRKISSKRQSSSKTAKESSPLPQSNPIPKDPDKLKSKTGVGSPRSVPCHKTRHHAVGKVQNRESVKGSSTQRDELVKYMSNLPGYLQRADRGENIQEKALNVGVLDWSRLEKWKSKQPAVGKNFTSFYNSGESSSRAATTSSTIAGDHRKLDGKRGFPSSFKASYKEGLPESSKLSSQNVKGYQHSETEIKTLGDELGIKPWEFESFGETQSDTSLQKKRNDYGKITSLEGSVASKSRHHGVSIVPKEKANGRDAEAKKSMEGLQQHSLKKKEKNPKSSSDTGLKSKKKVVSSSSHKKMSSSSSEARKMMNQWQESDIDAGHKAGHSKPSNIVLLRPRKVLQSSSPDYFELSQLRTSSDENSSESSQSSLSFISLPQKFSTEVRSQIPHSSVLPSMPEPSSETLQHSVNTDLDINHSSTVSKEPACSNKISSLQSEDNFILGDVLDIKPRNQCAFSNMKESQDQETAELTDQMSRNLSFHHRPSFSLNRIGRSFSLKERSTLPQLSSLYASAKSGPVTSQSSACSDNSSKEKVRRHNRTRSSPFLRLLDPILKNKASNTRHSAESSPTSNGSMNSITFTTTNLHAEKSKGSSIQALLQLTIRNGLPLFKFVLNNERKVLAATMKSLASPEKDDVGCCFTFYVVNEIKKKSGGWMSYGSKDKSCGYVYNMVGQMKLSGCKINEPSNQNYKRQCMVKEYVLLGVEINQTDQGPAEFIKRRELAGIVIEIPCESLSHEGLQNNNLLQKGCLKCLAEDRCFCTSEENDISGSTTVILPSGVHSSPNNGEPSRLIDRWRSGGSCDCGGWDVGCKLLVLCSKSYLEIFQLFVQEGAEQNTPLFTLVPLKDGLYTVEFSSTIDHLQAFFISVAVLSSQKLPNSMEMSNMHEEINQEFNSKNNNEFQGKAPIYYNPIPPLSPVGRV